MRQPQEKLVTAKFGIFTMLCPMCHKCKPLPHNDSRIRLVCDDCFAELEQAKQTNDTAP